MSIFLKNSQKKLGTLFARWWFLGFFLMAGVYVWKSKRVKNMQDYTPKNIWSLGMFIYWGKNVFSQSLPCKTIAVKFVIFFFNKYFFLLLWLPFVIQTTLLVEAFLYENMLLFGPFPNRLAPSLCFWTSLKN